MGGEFGQRDQADVRHAEEGIGDAGAGDVDRLEAEVLDDARGERIGGARQQHGFALAQQIAQASVARIFHRRFFPDRA